MSYLLRVRAELAERERRDLIRRVRRELPARCIDFSSNDYLGLSGDDRLLRAMRASDVVGSGGSRLLGGAHREHAMLEDELAGWTGRERALLFSSGYLAALGAITTLAHCVDRAYSDALVHACAIDALRLTKLPREVYPHATQPDRGDDSGAAMIVSETTFSMSGQSVSPLGLTARMRAGDVLVLDEAHALGVMGPRGSGLAAGLPDPRIVIIGTLSKAIGAAGGFVAGPADTIALMATAARTFVFDTAPPPAVSAAARVALAIVRGDEGDERRARLARNARRLRSGLRERGFDVADGDSAIVSLVIGHERDALHVAAKLEQNGIFAPAIRPPTVPAGTARLRITVRANHTDEQIDATIAALAQANVPLTTSA